jgi:predicted nucleic acid-binding protein
MIYLDTGCLVKLYYPEPDSSKVAALVAGKQMYFSPLHELEFTNALHLKIFHGSATSAQTKAAESLVEADVKSGVLSKPVQ